MLYIIALLLLFGTYVYLALNNCQMYQALNNCKNISTNIPLRAMKTLSGTLSRTMSSSLLINETPPYQLYSWDCKPPGNGVNAIFSVLYRINSIQHYHNFVSYCFLSLPQPSWRKSTAEKCFYCKPVRVISSSSMICSSATSRELSVIMSLGSSTQVKPE